MIGEKDNLTKELTQDGRLVLEPGFAGYLRSQGYQVTGVTEIQTVSSESDPDKEYLVCKIETHKYPQGDSRLDLVADGVEVPVCTCWSWRNKSADLETEQPQESGTCKHIREAYRVERATADDQQETLI